MSTLVTELRTTKTADTVDDPSDIFTQCESLLRLSDGWLDGEGKAPSKSGVHWVAEQIKSHFPSEATPYLYPTLEGGVRAEWSAGDWEFSLEINLETRSGYWHALCMNDVTDEEQSLDLNRQDHWDWVRTAVLNKKWGMA